MSNPTPVAKPGNADNPRVFFDVDIVLKGMGVVKMLEGIETKDDNPVKPCIIAECGEHKAGDDCGIAPNDGSGDAYPDFPEDSNMDFKDANKVLSVAEDVKNIGNNFFKAQNWQSAIKKYSKALRYLEICGNTLDDDSAQKKLEPTALSCILNTALHSQHSRLKLKLWQEAIESCDEALELNQTNTKALFRRAQAWQGLKEFNKAMVPTLHRQKYTFISL
uniref:peptidylprolyl isomerase n=1 Tax=Sinocyclocheilus rhinocerous TaxID=307959 RepID=A0A673LLG5_9TELE